MAMAMPEVKDSFTGPSATFDMVKLVPRVSALSFSGHFTPVRLSPVMSLHGTMLRRLCGPKSNS